MDGTISKHIFMAGTISRFGVAPISTHCWSGDKNFLSFSMNNEEVSVMKRGDGPGKWDTSSILNQHDLLVTGIDWAPKTNRIVTCSADRNAYVWNLDVDGTWKHTLVLLRINRAATCVKWSPEENKFAVGSGARLISVCHFESENDWWVAKHIRKPIKSTITALDWHPNNCLLAAGSSGFKMRVYSAYVKEIEKQPDETSWGDETPFQNPIVEFSNSLQGGGWVHSVSFSGDGNRLAWVSHDSSISVADATRQMEVFRLKTEHLPFLSCLWISPDTIVAAGYGSYGYAPSIFKVHASNQVEFVSELEVTKRDSTDTALKGKIKNIWKDRTYKDDTVLPTTHQGQISCIQIHAGTKYNAKKISTSGGDGKIVVWDLTAIKKLNS